MKTIQDLFAVIAQATEQSSREHRTLFIDYSGHVNTLSLEFWLTGWSGNKDDKQLAQRLNVRLDDEDSISAAYYWVKAVAL